MEAFISNDLHIQELLSKPGNHLPRAPQQHWKKHTVYCWEGVRWTVAIPGCACDEGRGWYRQHICVQEANPHRPIPSLWVPSPNGTQEGSDKNTHALGWGTLLFRCKPGPGKEACAGTLEKNGYPATFVQRLELPQPERDEEQPAWTSVTIPYIHGLSQSICRVLSHLDIRVAFCPFRTLRQELVHLKDPVPELRRKGVVYTIPYDQCPQRYIGQTRRCLQQHLVEHCRALRKGDVLASAVAEHVFASGHQLDLSKARVMDSHPHTQTQYLLESWHI